LWAVGEAGMGGLRVAADAYIVGIIVTCNSVLSIILVVINIIVIIIST